MIKVNASIEYARFCEDLSIDFSKCEDKKEAIFEIAYLTRDILDKTLYEMKISEEEYSQMLAEFPVLHKLFDYHRGGKQNA